MLNTHHFKTALPTAFLVFGLLFIITGVRAQYLKIGTIDIYGNKTVTTKRIGAILKLNVGDSILMEDFKPQKIGSLIKEALPGVRAAGVYPVCCDTNGNWMIYIGIAETKEAVFTPRPINGKDIVLPAEIFESYTNYEKRNEEGVTSGNAGEDDSAGMAFSKYPPARAEQKKFITYASNSFSVLKQILQQANNPQQRAAAAAIIAYYPDKKTVRDLLIGAVNDPDDDVRNNAVRAIGILAGYLNAHPQLNISIPLLPFIGLVNSYVWSDRNKGAMVLFQLSNNRDKAVLNLIRQKALFSLEEMAGWADRSHAMMAFMVLARIAGMSDEKSVQKNFSPGWSQELKLIKNNLRQAGN